VITIEIRVKPNARTSKLTRLEDGTWKAELKAPPVDGKANEALIALVAKQFGCPRSAVAIRRGATGRRKLVTISHPK
jgi:uncharacterized protein